MACLTTVQIPSLTPSSQWRHNESDSVSNHRSLDCLLNRLFRRRKKKHQSPASLAFVREIYWGPVNSPRKGPVPQKMFPLDYVIMLDFAAVLPQAIAMIP